MRISQPTVSEHIARLERLLGVTLFERTGRRIALTDAGRLYYEYCQKIVRLTEEATHAVEQLRGLLRGRLIIGASTIPGTYLLPDIVAQFHKRYPQIEIEVHITDSAKVEAGLLSGEWQVGFMGRHPQRKELEARPFAEDEVVLVSKRRLEGMGSDDLLRLDFVAREEGSATQAVFEEALRRNGL
ncbi:MAG: LysR family transcriptional regulator, partial [Planctomycetota bacterium]